jgi:nitrogen regulatory protein PII
MKKIEAYVRHEAFDAIREDLLRRGFPSLTSVEVKGSGRYTSGRPRLKLEIAVADRDGSMVIDTILRHARTGDVGDGKIFVSTIDAAYRIRTGDEDEEILNAHAPGEIPR